MSTSLLLGVASHGKALTEQLGDVDMDLDAEEDGDNVLAQLEAAFAPHDEGDQSAKKKRKTGSLGGGGSANPKQRAAGGAASSTASSSTTSSSTSSSSSSSSSSGARATSGATTDPIMTRLLDSELSKIPESRYLATPAALFDAVLLNKVRRKDQEIKSCVTAFKKTICNMRKKKVAAALVAGNSKLRLRWGLQEKTTNTR